MSVKLTEREWEIIRWISDETEFEGYGDYIYHDEWDMKIYRGVISSLIQKKVCEIDYGCSDEKDNGGYTWLYLIDPEIHKILDTEKTEINYPTGKKWEQD